MKSHEVLSSLVRISGSCQRALRTAVALVTGKRRDTPITLVMAAPYQDLYLEKIEPLLAVTAGQRVRRLHVHETLPRLRRWHRMATDHGIAFQSQPFLTRKFPATRDHVWVTHGLDNGRRDALGTFSFGPGRMLSETGQRLYSSLLVNSPWAVSAATAEVPAYANRVFVQGDWRVDALQVFAAQRPVVDRHFHLNPELPTVGMYTTHGKGSAFSWFSTGLERVLTELSRTSNVMVFFHPFERKNQPELFTSVTRLCARNDRVHLVENTEIERGLSVCDLLIGDMSSVSLYFSMLARPMLFTPFSLTQLAPGFPGEQLVRAMPMLSTADELIEMVASHDVRSVSGRFPVPSPAFRERLYPSGLRFATAAPMAIRNALECALKDRLDIQTSRR